MIQSPTYLSTSADHTADDVDLLAQAALAASPVVELRDLTVVRDGEQLLISGRVNCFYHKQLAQETVRPHAANLQMINTVDVAVD